MCYKQCWEIIFSLSLVASFLLLPTLLLPLQFLVLQDTLHLQFQSSIGSSFDVVYPHHCFPEYEFGTFEVALAEALGSLRVHTVFFLKNS